MRKTHTDKDKKAGSWDIWGRLPAITEGGSDGPWTHGGGPNEFHLKSSVFGSCHTRKEGKCSPGTRNCTCGGRETELAGMCFKMARSWVWLQCSWVADCHTKEIGLGQVQNASHTVLGSSAYRKPRSYPGSDLVNFVEDASGNKTDGLKSSPPKSLPGL